MKLHMKLFSDGGCNSVQGGGSTAEKNYLLGGCDTVQIKHEVGRGGGRGHCTGKAHTGRGLLHRQKHAKSNFKLSCYGK